MTLREKAMLVEEITADKKFAKTLCDNFVFDVEDGPDEETIVSGANFGDVVNGRLNITNPHIFRINLTKFLTKLAPSLLWEAVNIDSRKLMGNNFYQTVFILRLAAAVQSCATIEVKDDDAILMVCLFKMDAHKQRVTETAALAYFNDIKRKLKHNHVDAGQFAATVNNLLKLRIIDMEDEKILLTEVIIHKNSIDSILKTQQGR